MKSPPVPGNLGRGPTNLVSELYDPHFGVYGSPVSSSSSHGSREAAQEELTSLDVNGRFLAMAGNWVCKEGQCISSASNKFYGSIWLFCTCK
ncbi:hypothetical protein M6B38_409425 [Iris pallida]|uniref:Uncharacterized protein n=1 Tax=Iris pallida TaxID=29817 RepID=A0AAX6FNB8_IRIPA|nr:hypothetical protein M6B38_409425 [Iris pallida]